MAEVIIKFRNTIATANTDFVTSLGGDIKHVYSSINALSASVPDDKIELLRADPSVEYVELDQEAHILGFPAEEGITVEQIKLLAATQVIPWGVQKIRAPEVWPEGDKGTGIKVCIVDTGIDYNHPDLKDNYKGGYNFITNTADPMDDNGHGTHVSGIVAALDNDIGVVGVAPEAFLFAYKVLDANGSGSYSNIIAAIQAAIDNKMQIISMSLGGTGYSKPFEDICNTAYNSGIVIVAAAGNQGGTSGDTITYPGKFASVVAVAATDSNDQRASFSSMGPELEVAAPGVSVPSTVPSSGKYGDPSGYKNLSGTSMACPHVTGTVALIKKVHPDLTNVDIRNLLNKTAVDLGPPGKDDFFGYGLIDAKAAVDNTPPQPPVLSKIAVSPATASVIIGGTQQFKATALDQYNNPMASITISWAVDNPAVGGVNPPSAITGPDGIALTTFTALAEGTATVTASNGNITGHANVTVTKTPPPPVLTKIAVSPPTSSLVVGGTQQFKATALDQNNNPMAGIIISWAVNNPNVGGVVPPSSTTGPDGNALTTFTALAAGTAAVTATNGNVSGSANVTVTTPPPPVKNFTVHPLGMPGKPSGILVLRRTRGDYTSDEACQKVCEILKKM